MAESKVQLPPDGTGKAIRTVEVTTSQGLVEMEVDVLGYQDGTFADADVQKLRNLDLALSALRDALRGASSKTLSDIAAALASVAVTGPLTDTQLRASALPVSGTFWQADQLVHATNLDITLTALAASIKNGKTLADVVAALASVGVTGPLTDGQLRASPPAVAQVEAAPLIAQSATATTSGNTAIYTPNTGKSIRLYYIAYSADQAVTQVRAAIRFGAAGVLRYAMRLTGNQAFARGISGGRRYLTAGPDVVLYANQDVAATVDYSFELDEV